MMIVGVWAVRSVIMPVRVGNFGSYVGLLADSDIRRVDIALLTFLGFARPS